MKNEIKSFWVVTNQRTIHSELCDICFEATPGQLMLQALGGLRPSEVLLVTSSKKEAIAFAKKQLGAK